MATAPSPNDLTRQQLDELDALLQRMLSLPLNPPEAGTPGAYTPGSPTPASPDLGPLPAPPLPDVVIPPAVKNWRVDPPAPAPSPAPHLLAAPVPDPPASNPGGHTPGSPHSPVPEPRHVPDLPPTIFIPPDPLPAPASRLPGPQPVPPAPAPHAQPNPTPPGADGTSSSVPSTRPSPPAAPAKVESPAARASRHPVLGTLPSRPRSPVADDLPLWLWPADALTRAADALLGLFGPPGRFLRSGFGKNLLGAVGAGLLVYTAAHVAQVQGWVSLPLPLPWPR
jgi:hypothetical protein